MKRLTAKFDNKEMFNGYYDNAKNVSNESQKAILEKLGKLEDLEEKIGMSLEVLFNVVGKDIYIVDLVDSTYMPFTINAFYLDNSIYYLSYVDSMGLDMCVKSNDYNKHWFLTREEAKKKLEELKNGK